MTEWLSEVRGKPPQGVHVWKDAHAQQLGTDACGPSTLAGSGMSLRPAGTLLRRRRAQDSNMERMRRKCKLEVTHRCSWWYIWPSFCL